MDGEQCSMIRTEQSESDSAGAKRSCGETARAPIALAGPRSRWTRARQTPATACVAFLQLSWLPTAEAMVLFGIEVSTGIATIFVVIVFLFVVPCITKLIHIIRKSLSLSKCAATLRPSGGARVCAVCHCSSVLSLVGLSPVGSSLRRYASQQAPQCRPLWWR